MEVILRQDIDKVGLRGEVVNVARGYARNFLFPRGLAHEATPARVAEIRKVEERRSQHEAKTFDEAQALAEKVGQIELRFDVKAGPTGALFGSVTATDVADELWRTRKVRVDRRKIDLHDPIKRIGRYAVPIDVFTDVRVEVKTLVVPEGGELPPEEELEAAREAEEAAEREAVEREAAEHRAAAEAVAAVEAEETEEAEAEDAEAAEAGPAAEAEAGAPEEPAGAADADSEPQQERA